MVVVAQARDTDYFYRRDFPVSGSAYFKILIPYKIISQADIIEVFEQGLHANECYFPATTVFEEGRRYLLFVRLDPEDEERFRGLATGCAIDVLVHENNRYAIRYPVKGIDFSEDFSALAKPMTFSDPYAIVTDEDLSAD